MTTTLSRLHVAARSPFTLTATTSPSLSKKLLPATPLLRHRVPATSAECRLVRSLHSSTRHEAGHNRWSKIFRKKAIADQGKSLALTKHSAKIKSAIQTGGSADPESNFRLASLVAQAKELGMSKSQVEAVLKTKKASEHVLFEARAQAGYFIILDTLTTGKIRCRNELKKILQKNGAALGEPGSSLFNFIHKGIVRVPQIELQSSHIDSDELAIEVGAEEVILEEDESNPDSDSDMAATKSGQEDEKKCYQFICDPKDLSAVAGAIKENYFTVVSASLEYTPKSWVKLSDSEYEKAEHLIGLLEANEEVIEIYDNFVVDEKD